MDFDEARHCGARKKNGLRCIAAKGAGTDHLGYGSCKWHGGHLPGPRKAAHRAMAADAVARLGLPLDVDPGTALLTEVKRAAGAVSFLDAKLAEIDPDGLVYGVRLERLKSGPDGAERTLDEGPGFNEWVKLWHVERRLLKDAAVAALAAGIEERRVRLAEEQGALLADAIRGILADLGLTREQQAKVATVVPAHLRRVAAAAS